MNPQRNLLQQIAGLKEVPAFFRWGQNNAAARAALELGSTHVRNAIDDCLVSLVPTSIRFKIKEDVPGAKRFISSFERTKRNLQRLVEMDIYFTWQARYHINQALSPIERLFTECHWGEMQRACAIQFPCNNLFQRVDVYNNDVYFCRTILDATLVFTQIEVDIITEVLQYTSLYTDDFDVLHSLNLSHDFAMQNDVGNLIRPRP